MHGIETFIGCLHSEKDIAILIYLCQNNILPRVRRRLNDFERRRIRNGSIFVYEENESNIKRWTDGKIWSPSRCSGLFLVYTEQSIKPANNKVLMKKTITAKLKGHTYHVISYVNLDEELNGVCCLKYGNRLRMIHMHCQRVKNNCDNDVPTKPTEASSENTFISNLENVNPNIMQKPNIKRSVSNNNQSKNDDIPIFDESQNGVKTYENRSNEINQLHSNSKSLSNDKPKVFEINDGCAYSEEEYFYLENPLYKEMNQYHTIDSSENE